ncbi:LysR substrate-binding domain-containing protein, partial [Pseudomonas aeruginosa]
GTVAPVQPRDAPGRPEAAGYAEDERGLGVPGSLLARWFIPRLDRLNRALPDLRLQLSTSEGEFDPRRPGLDAMLWFAEPPWPADMQVFELAPERMGPVVSPRLAQETGLAQA